MTENMAAAWMAVEDAMEAHAVERHKLTLAKEIDRYASIDPLLHAWAALLAAIRSYGDACAAEALTR